MSELLMTPTDYVVGVISSEVLRLTARDVAFFLLWAGTNEQIDFVFLRETMRPQCFMCVVGERAERQRERLTVFGDCRCS